MISTTHPTHPLVALMAVVDRCFVCLGEGALTLRTTHPTARRVEQVNSVGSAPARRRRNYQAMTVAPTLAPTVTKTACQIATMPARQTQQPQSSLVTRWKRIWAAKRKSPTSVRAPMVRKLPLLSAVPETLAAQQGLARYHQMASTPRWYWLLCGFDVAERLRFSKKKNVQGRVSENA